MNARGYLARLPLLALVACVHLPRVAPEVRTGKARASSAVRVESACGNWSSRSGSGVIISKRHVLTAAHVVGCADIPTVRVTYIDDDGRERRLRMLVTEEDRDADIAKLEIASAEQFAVALRPPVVRSPDPGNGVCASLASSPDACGTIASTWTVVKRLATVERDAGAPVYCDQGTLVSIVVNRGGQDGPFPYTWIAPVDAHWLADIVPAPPSGSSGRGVASL